MCQVIPEYYNELVFDMYDKNDNYICSFENIEDLRQFFNMETKEVLRKLRNRSYFVFCGHFVKVFEFPKARKYKVKSR